MKNKKYALFLFFEAVLLLVMRFAFEIKAESAFDVLSYPLQKLADFLGFLSLKSPFGNAVAIVLYTLLCLSPVFVLILKKARKTFTKTDSVLVLVSAVLFAVIYLLINPSELGIHNYGEDVLPMVAFSFWAFFLGYLILKFTDKVSESDETGVQKLLSLVLKVIGAVFVFALCSIKTTSTEIGIMTLLGFVNTAVPHLLGLVTVLLALGLSDDFSADRYSESTLSSSKKLTKFCITSLKISVAVGMVYNLLQLRFITELSSVNFHLQVPLFSLGFILLVLIFTSFIKESKALKEDNDSFI